MKLIIDIPETDYEWLKRNPFPLVLPTKIERAIANGIPLDVVLDNIRGEIIEKYWDCEICKWKIDYKPHYNVRGDINDILQIIDKYKAESEG